MWRSRLHLCILFLVNAQTGLVAPASLNMRRITIDRMACKGVKLKTELQTLNFPHGSVLRGTSITDENTFVFKKPSVKAS